MGALLVIGCAVCGAGEEASRGSYIWMSIIISLLPLAMLGGIVAWVVFKSREAERSAAEEPAGLVRLDATGEVSAPTVATFARVKRTKVKGESVSSTIVSDRG